MNCHWVSPSLPYIVWFAFAVGVVALVVLYGLKQQSGERAGCNLLRLPGESLRIRLARLGATLEFYVMLLFLSLLLPALPISIWQRVCETPHQFITGWVVFFLLISIGLVAFLLDRVFRLLLKRRSVLRAYECELAVGQELNMLMRQGCVVYHGFPGDDFDIDHILIGPSGVYAIESLNRDKPEKRLSEIGNRVYYDGRVLLFPDGQEIEIVTRAKKQAAWLADWLTKVVGDPVSVKGIVYLPGWTVETSGRHEISVVNEQSTSLLGRPRGGQDPLSDDMVQRIACQVELRCRNMN